MKRWAFVAVLSCTLPAFAGQQQPDPQPREPAALAAALSPVTAERLVNAEAEPHNWLMYSGDYESRRYSGLDQIHRKSVPQLQVQWAYQLQEPGRAGTTPLVVDGMMYITESPSSVIALDAATGRLYWRYDHPLPDELNFCCGPSNRGVAILGDRLFMSTLDAHVVALDARTGSVIWDVEAGDPKAGYSKKAAPLVVGNKVITGIGGGEFGIRGFVDAYEAQTGDRIWRFYTIPGPDHPDNRSWEGDSWRTGGSPTWITGSYDPELNLVYWGTGNPGPGYNGKVRGGDNLYSDSVLALDANTGEMRWYFQFTPHDMHDWDATQIPVLADALFDGRQRKLMLWPNRNGFFYVLDRETGEFLLGKPFAKQTWAEGLDDRGRPIRKPNTSPSEEGTLVAPPAGGAANYWSPSYSPRTGLIYVMAFDGEAKFFIREDEYVAGQRFAGGGPQQTQPIDNEVSAVRAIVPQTGDVKWEYRVQPKSRSGLLSTAGDLLFGGTVDGYFFALDALTGEELWHLSVGGRVNAAPISYAVDGRQYVTIQAGTVLFTFGLEGDSE